MTLRAALQLSRGLSKAIKSTGQGQQQQQPRCLAIMSLGPRGGAKRESNPRRTEHADKMRAAEVQRCADKGWKSAIVCLGNMRKGGVSPGVSAYNVALRTCAGAGEFDRAEALFADLKSSGALPNQASFDAMSAALEASKDSESAPASDSAQPDGSKKTNIKISASSSTKSSSMDEPSWSGATRPSEGSSNLAGRTFATSAASVPAFPQALSSSSTGDRGRKDNDFKVWGCSMRGSTSAVITEDWSMTGRMEELWGND